MDIKTLRAKLESHRGRWSLIASVAGVNRKTIHRIVNDAEYNPTIATVTDIERAVASVSRKQERREKATV